MSVVALVGGVVLYLLLQDHLRSGVEGAPLLRGLGGKRLFERAMVALSWRWARSLEALLGTRRLQPQLRLVVCVAFAAALVPLYLRGLESGRLAPHPRSDEHTSELQSLMRT